MEPYELKHENDVQSGGERERGSERATTKKISLIHSGNGMSAILNY